MRFQWKLRVFSLTIALFCLLILIFHVFSYRGIMLWDFRKDYTAALLYRAGYNPYDHRALSLVSGLKSFLQYSYPLATTFLFMPFTYLNYSHAALIWLFLVLSILSMLILIWWHFYTDNISIVLFPAFAFLIFNLALPKSVFTGNINTVETALIWFGLLALIKGRTRWFSTFLGFASVFKLSPLILVGVMLIHKNTRRWSGVVIALVIVVTMLSFSFLLEPSWFASYRINLGYASAAFTYPTLTIYALAYRILKSTALSETQKHICVLITYIAASSLFVWLALLTFRRLSATAWSAIGIPIIMYACLTYALIVPRFADYNYLLIIPAAWYAFQTTLSRKWTPLWLGMFLFPLCFININFVNGDFRFEWWWWSYWSLFMLVFAWGVMTCSVLCKNLPHQAS